MCNALALFVALVTKGQPLGMCFEERHPSSTPTRGCLCGTAPPVRQHKHPIPDLRNVTHCTLASRSIFPALRRHTSGEDIHSSVVLEECTV